MGDLLELLKFRRYMLTSDFWKDHFRCSEIDIWWRDKGRIDTSWKIPVVPREMRLWLERGERSGDGAKWTDLRDP